MAVCLRSLAVLLGLALVAPASLGTTPQATPTLSVVAVGSGAGAQAFALAEKIDDDEFRSRLLLDLVEFHLRADRPDEALSVARRIPDYRKGVALARVATRTARTGATGGVEALLSEALAQTSFPRQWQREAIQAEVAIARAAGGNDAGARELYDRLSEDAARYRAQAGIAVEQARRGEAIDLETFAAAGKTTKLSPDLLELVRGLLEIADLADTAANREALKPLCEKAEELIRACRATAGEELLDLGILWRRIGDKDRSARLIAQAIRHLPPGTEMQGWRYGYFAKLVRLYADAGEAEKVAEMLKLAHEGTARLHPFHQPPALCQLAEAELAVSTATAAEATWTRALEVALANPNPGSRYVGATQVALSLARCGHDVPAPIARHFTSLLPPPAKSESDAATK